MARHEEGSMKNAEWGVQCNVRAPHRFMRFGAKCIVVDNNPGNGGEHVEVHGMSRGGRKVRTWMDARDLGNYRPIWIGHRTDFNGDCARKYASKEDAARFAAAMQKHYGDIPARDTRPSARRYLLSRRKGSTRVEWEVRLDIFRCARRAAGFTYEPRNGDLGFSAAGLSGRVAYGTLDK